MNINYFDVKDGKLCQVGIEMINTAGKLVELHKMYFL